MKVAWYIAQVLERLGDHMGVKNWEENAKILAEAHIDWLLGMLRPLLIDVMKHGYKHGLEEKE